MNYLRSSINMFSRVTQHVQFFEKEIQKQAPQARGIESRVNQAITGPMSNFENRETIVLGRLNSAYYLPVKPQEGTQVAHCVQFFENAIVQHRDLQEASGVKIMKEEVNKKHFALRQAGYLPLERSSTSSEDQVIEKAIQDPVQDPLKTASSPSQATKKAEIDSSQVLIASHERKSYELPIINWNEIKWQANLLHYEEGRLTKSMMKNPAFKRHAKIRLPLNQILFEKLKVSEELKKFNLEEKILSHSNISESIEENLEGSCLIKESQENQELGNIYQEAENWEKAILAMEKGEYVPDIGMTAAFKRGIRDRLPIPSFV